MSRDLETARPMAAEQVLQREFLELRAKVLELAASLDRMDRGDGELPADGRMDAIRQALQVLMAAGPDRAEKVQLVFSRDYDPSWPSQLGVPRPEGR